MTRFSPCAEDARVSKMIFHYESLKQHVVLVCVSRGNTCTRLSSEFITHKTLNLSKLSFLKNLSGPVRRVTMRVELLYFALYCRLSWRPSIAHGCDLDGYLVAKLAFPTGVKRIFEVYDPWSTMTSSKKIARLEAREFQKSDFLIMPAYDSRIKVARKNQMSFGNEMDIDLAVRLLHETEEAYELLRKKLPDIYLLSGGSLGDSVGTDRLIDFYRSHPEFNLVIAGTLPSIPKYQALTIPQNVHILGKQRWGVWLHLLRNSIACWAYYDQEVDHYASHISPNKYWEACLFKVPLFVSNLNQFCDRSDLEPLCVEMYSEIQTGIAEGLILLSKRTLNAQNLEKEYTYWKNRQDIRRRQVAEVLNQLKSPQH